MKTDEKTAALRVAYALSASAQVEENYWIRLQQEETRAEVVSVAEAAELIDKLYDIDPCNDTEKNGGAAAEDGGQISDEKFATVAVDFLGGLCDDASFYTARVRVLRSHPAPAYTLRSETARVQATENVSHTVSETLELGGAAHIDLSWPYAGQLSGIPAGVRAEVRGSTLNLVAYPGVTLPQYLTVRYLTRYDVAVLRVPIVEEPVRQESDETQARRQAAEAAGLIAFWPVSTDKQLAVAISLDAPETDESTEAERAELCRSMHIHYELAESPCSQTVRHYSICQCSGRRTGEYDEVQECGCPKGKSGEYLGIIEQLDGYVACEGEDEQIADPEYYQDQCCHEPKGELPQCREVRERYEGGAEIEGGPDYYKSLYGPNVRLVAQSPADGPCGEKIRSWEVRPKNCCAEVRQALTPAPGLPKHLAPGETAEITVHYGKPGPLTWRAFGGLEFAGGRQRLKKNYAPTETERKITVTARTSTCRQPYVTVDDGCAPLNIFFGAADQAGPRLSMRAQSMDPAGGEVVFPVSVLPGTGVEPFSWDTTVGLQVLSVSADTRQVLVRAQHDGNTGCIAVLTVRDACGNTDELTLNFTSDAMIWRSATWEEYEKIAQIIKSGKTKLHVVSEEYHRPGEPHWMFEAPGIGFSPGYMHWYSEGWIICVMADDCSFYFYTTFGLWSLLSNLNNGSFPLENGMAYIDMWSNSNSPEIKKRVQKDIKRAKEEYRKYIEICKNDDNFIFISDYIPDALKYIKQTCAEGAHPAGALPKLNYNENLHACDGIYDPGYPSSKAFVMSSIVGGFFRSIKGPAFNITRYVYVNKYISL